MRPVKDDLRLLDFAFRHEQDQPQPVKDLIASTYAAAARADCSELAQRRYRKGEHRIKTCLEMFISEPQYYKLLRVFLQTAKEIFDADALVTASPAHG